ncbi:protein kinase family protein [Cellulomonas humilata]|uniref:protein kinase family protein n=1 Tax=Cellulomonas humilata TaxID=144055 RepID=UPI0027D8C570|nr:protein kinase family protein [Cellulomonas humilata]
MRVVDMEVLVSEVVGRGTVLAGRYRVLSPVVSDLEGASAWQATDQILDRPVRVRILEHGAVAPALDAARRAALVTDARLVRVLDVGTHEGYGYVVSEQLVGQSLARLVAQGPLTADQARAVVGEAASALEIARRRGVHHLALRPSVLHVSPDGRVLLGGLALDAALLGDSGGDARSTTRADAVGLVRLLYAALTGLWPADPRAPQTPGGETLPPAPIVDGAPVAPADLVPGVPNDLDTLCVVTLGPNDDGPHSPGELVRELEPWGEIRASVAETAVLGGPATAQFPPTGAAAPGGGIPVPSEHDDQDTAPVTVQRQSVRTAFAQQDPPGANRPGTPPPATPSRATALGAAVPSDTETPPTGQPVITPPVFAQAAPPPPPPPVVPAVVRRPVAQATAAAAAAPPPPPPREEPLEAFGFSDVIGAETEPTSTRRFDPTALILILVVIAVIVGVVLAFKALFASLDPSGSSADPDPSSSESAPAVAGEPSQEPSAPEESAAPDGSPPVIASTTSIDPSDADGEHQEDVAKAYDGDPSTFWYTQTYKRDDFAGFKDAVGYAITLTQKTTVTTVTLRTNSNGGNVEIRATDAANPTGGPVLASGPFGPETVFTLDPATETQSLVLWITQLPTAADGGFRLELTEIALS